MKKLLVVLLPAVFILVPHEVFAQSVGVEWFSGVELSIPIILGLGAIDAINPCVIGVLLLLLSVLLRIGDKSLVWKNGLAYTAGVYLTYIVGGLTLLGAFNLIRDIVFLSQIFYLGIGAFVLFAGTLEVKDFFWYGRWFSLAIPKRFIGYIERQVQTVHLSLATAAFFGFVVTLIELPCTGAPYIAILTLMSKQGFGYVKALPLLLLYNLVFVLPLLVIIALAYFGVGLKRFHTWKQERRGTMRLGIGLALWAVGVWIITTLHPEWLTTLLLLLLGVVGAMAAAKHIFGYGREWRQ